MPTPAQVPIKQTYQSVDGNDPAINGPANNVLIQEAASPNIYEGGWQADPYTIPVGNELIFAAFEFDFSGYSGPPVGAVNDEPWYLYISDDGSDISTIAAWDTIASPTNFDTYRLLTRDGVGQYIVTDALKAMGYGLGGSTSNALPELRFSIHRGRAASGNLPVVRQTLINGRFRLTYEEFADWRVGTTFGSESNQNNSWVRATDAGVTQGSKTKVAVKVASDVGATLGAATNFGNLIVIRPGLELGESTQVVSKSTMRQGLVFGTETLTASRIVVSLRLLAGKVTRDVGYMWVPVYLQLPENDDPDTPLEFFYPSGTVIPHLVRNNYENQVRALVYMRPSVTEAQPFYVRVG